MSYAWQTLSDGRQVYRRIEEHEPARSSLPCPMISLDTMPAAQHPCDGQHYDSKSAFRRVTKAHGCIELGNDKPDTKKPTVDRAGIRASLEKAKARLNA